ncbi:recombination mediator RecR [Marinivivus vitaminiproducens]|uniref:recombination mediator RecR n=1 Tax=Marinivivus vitaminiproducens TaxID=3035935 RepID=UPI0027A92DE4|nr:recombination mediator RecR [Geminicoccaceae bacterium SCSIO 64248]
MAADPLDNVIRLLGRLPGLGPRSARRAALFLLKRREQIMEPLADALAEAAKAVLPCPACGNLDTVQPCAICRDPERDGTAICVVEDVEDLWALERASTFTGRYHVLGGTLSALNGVRPEDLGIDRLIGRIGAEGITEVILALGATVDGQTTAHYLAERLAGSGAQVSALAHGLPMGGELNYLDAGTLGAALRARRPLA